MLGTKSIHLFASSLTSELVHESIHAHVFKVPAEALRSDIHGIAESTVSITGAGIVHEILCQSSWHKNVAIFLSILEASSSAIPVELQHPGNSQISFNWSLGIHISLIDLACAFDSFKPLSTFIQSSILEISSI